MKRYKLLTILFFLTISTNSSAVEYNNAIKVTFLSWATGSTKLSYERAFKSHQSGEICVSMIGAGYDKYHNKPLGYTLRYGHKFFVMGNEGEGLRGFYLRPEAIYSTYYYNLKETEERTLARMGTLLGTIGYQTNFGRFLVDTWVGAGYALGTPAETGYHHGFALWNLFGTHNDNISLSFSIRLGYCF